MNDSRPTLCPPVWDIELVSLTADMQNEGRPPHSTSSRLPNYLPMQSAYHHVCSDTLHEMIACVPLPSGSRVLDVACGDGCYSHWLTQRIGPQGIVVAADLLQGCLEVARRNVRQKQQSAPAAFVQANVDRLPFSEDAFDLIGANG